MFSIISAFPNLILTNVIFSKNLQKIFISGTFCGTILNIILNIWLIPKYGAVGAAISTVATQFLIMLINWKKLKKFIPFNVSKHLKKVGIANIIFILIMCFMSFIGVHFILTTILSFIVYITTLYIIKEPIINDILSIRKI